LAKSALLDPLARYGPEGISTLGLPIHADWAASHLPALVEASHVQAAAPILEEFPQLQPLGERRRHLRLQLVADLTEALASQLPSVGNSQSAAQRFLEEVDAALILEALSPVKGVTQGDL
jgi:glutamate-5-semialdehyde dehydrogenase